MSKMKLNVRSRAQDGHFRPFPQKEGGSLEQVLSVVVRPIWRKCGNAHTQQVSAWAWRVWGFAERAFEHQEAEIAKTKWNDSHNRSNGEKPRRCMRSLTRINKEVSRLSPWLLNMELAEFTIRSRGGFERLHDKIPMLILVGEIRDNETASTAVNAALTGHLVLSTLHTNNAVDTIPRLVELGVKPSLN